MVIQTVFKVFIFNNKYYSTIGKILLMCIFLGIEINGFSQSYSYRHYDIEDGLPTSEIFQVFQDSKGYIWIATDNGVCRYNGYTFITYTNTDGLPDETVLEIYEDNKHRIWFIPHSVKLSYFVNDKIVEYKYNDTIQKLIKGNGTPEKLMFYVDSVDNIYLRDRRAGTLSVDSSGNIQLVPNEMYGLVFFKKGNKLILNNRLIDEKKGDDNFVYKIKEDNKLILSWSADSFLPDEFSSYGLIGGIVKDENYFIFFGKSLIHFKNNKIVSVKILPDDIIWISFDHVDNLWIGTRKGGYCYHDLSLNKPADIFLEGKSVSSVLQDNEGGYWFSTLYDGVYYLPNINIKSFNDADNPLIEEVFSLTSDSLTLWVGLSSKVIGLKDNMINQEIDLDEKDFIIYTLLCDINDRSLWIASSSVYNLKNKSLKRFELIDYNNERIVFSRTRDIIQDDKGRMWIVSGGLHKSINDTQFKRIHSFKNTVNSLCQQNADKLYLGCNNGLWEYSIDNEAFKFLGNENDLFKNKIKCIVKNSDQKNIWLGTKSKGILILDKDTVFQISTKEGLSHNSITSFFLKDSIMWVSTVNGLNKISFHGSNIKDFTIECFCNMHGIASNEINDIYIGDSLAYIATKNGLTLVDYKNLKPNSEPPPIYITRISVMDKDTVLQNHYELPYDMNSIRIEFVGLMYKNLKHKKYKYKLSQAGKKADWKETNENSVNLSFLPHGKYQFTVIAVNEDAIESIHAATISFTINPPFWKTFWFISTIVILILSLIFGFYKFRIREIHNRNRMEKKLLKEVYKFRQQALSQQMNPHFIFNTLNSIQYYLYENDTQSSGKYLSKFSKLMRLILDNSQHETIPIQKELDAMDLYLELESLRLEESFDYEIIVGDDIDANIYRINPLLIQPYVENAIWHGLIHKKGSKRIKIEIISDQDSFLCIIEDNGIGREKAMKIKESKGKNHVSHGTNITGKRIETINKLYNRNFKVEFIDLKEEKGQARGTSVLLRIPKILN